jgi:antibiotic biosynthesis monooxygenase (ABM) superfamily enzyme
MYKNHIETTMDIGNKVLLRKLQMVTILEFIRYLVMKMYFRWLEDRNRRVKQIG